MSSELRAFRRRNHKRNLEKAEGRLREEFGLTTPEVLLVEAFSGLSKEEWSTVMATGTIAWKGDVYRIDPHLLDSYRTKLASIGLADLASR